MNLLNALDALGAERIHESDIKSLFYVVQRFNKQQMLHIKIVLCIRPILYNGGGEYRA